MARTATKNVLVESDSRRGAYDMIQTRAIVQHHSLGRLLLVEGFGGMDSLSGGAYRWRHGLAYKIRDTETLGTLFDECTETGFTDADGMVPEQFSSAILEKIAYSAGL